MFAIKIGKKIVPLKAYTEEESVAFSKLTSEEKNAVRAAEREIALKQRELAALRQKGSHRQAPPKVASSSRPSPGALTAHQSKRSAPSSPQSRASAPTKPARKSTPGRGPYGAPVSSPRQATMTTQGDEWEDQLDEGSQSDRDQSEQANTRDASRTFAFVQDLIDLSSQSKWDESML